MSYSKRPRSSSKIINYGEKVEEEEITGLILPEDARRTSSWTRKVTATMNIRVTSKEIFNLALTVCNDHPLYLACISDDMWKKDMDIEELPTTPDIKTLVDEVNLIYNLNNNLLEYEVDTFVQSLLHVMKMNYYPLSINPQRRLVTKVGEKLEEIVSIPDFVIRFKRSKILIVVEDKNSSNATFANNWKEDQIMGEIFVAAHSTEIKEPCNIYGVRVIGTLFTFFEAGITPEYIRESLQDLPKHNRMDVTRYPDPGNNIYKINALDFCKLEDRKVVINYLEEIRKILLE